MSMVIGKFEVVNGVLELSDNIEFNNTSLKFDLNSDYDGSKDFMGKILNHTCFDWITFEEDIWESDIDPDILDTFLTWTITKNKHSWSDYNEVRPWSNDQIYI